MGIEKEKFLVEYMTEYLRQDPEFISYRDIIEPYRKIPEKNTRSILIMHGVFSEQPEKNTEIRIACYGKDLYDAKDLSFDVYKRFRGRYSVYLPLPAEVPDEMAGLGEFPATAIIADKIEPFPPGGNGLYAYSINVRVMS